MTNNMKEEALLPCPFCNKQPEIFPSGNGEGTMIECQTSGCVNPHTSWYGENVAKSKWNTRNPAPIPDEEILDVIGKAMIKADGCGLTIEGNHVLCSDKSVKAAGNDAYEKPLYNENCSCVQSCKAILKALSPYLRHKSETFVELKKQVAYWKNRFQEEENHNENTPQNIIVSELREVREAIKYTIPHYKVYGNTIFSEKLEKALATLDRLLGKEGE